MVRLNANQIIRFQLENGSGGEVIAVISVELSHFPLVVRSRKKVKLKINNETDDDKSKGTDQKVE